MSIDEAPKLNPPWYKRVWGVLIIGVGVLLLGVVIYIGFYTLRFYRDIQLGDIVPQVENKLTSGNIQAPTQLKESLAYSAVSDPTFGNEHAPLQIVEFADFECPYSKEESLVIRELQAQYPEKIHFIYRDFPLDELHPHAFRAAEAGQCANDQEKFWIMHDKLFQNAGALTDLDIKLYALEAGLDITKFNECFDGRKYKDEIEVDRADGIAAGVVGTPTFFVNGHKIAGAIPMEVWEQIVARVK